MSIKALDVQNHFASYHKQYQTAYGKVFQAEASNPPETMLSWIGEVLNLKGGDSLLDCGSGLGYPASFLSKKFECNVLGLNITDCQLEYSKKYETDRCRFIKFDFNHIDRLSHKPNKVIFLETFGYAENPKDLLRKCADIIPFDGLILIKSLYPSSLEDEALKEEEIFYHYSYCHIQDVFEWSCNIGLSPLLYVKTAFGNFETTYKFLSLIGKKFNRKARLYPYVLILQKQD